MKSQQHPQSEGDIQLSPVLYALSDPIRQHIVDVIREHGEQACNFFNVPIAKSTFSYHVKILREAGIIHARSQGTLRLLSLREEELEQRFPGLLDSILKAYEIEKKK
ncbi:ArsR/SmtB family transcription factor [Paenibacillus sp. NPDC058071]|uniref:ArsR/SmtB family transcription factor n=1 Tax=Paenibacillus sp. NPDC058071 TaxID=3346326 RepID=UPI0036DAC6CF